MELHERIRFLRKNTLKMSQTEFAEKLGVTRTVIKNIELNILARPDQKLSLLKLMCKEFNVNEKWLLDGEGEMFVQTDEFDLNEYMKSRGATDLEMELMRAYFDLDENIRKEIMEHFKSKLGKAAQKNPAVFIPDTPEKLEEIAPPVHSDKNEVS